MTNKKWGRRSRDDQPYVKQDGSVPIFGGSYNIVTPPTKRDKPTVPKYMDKAVHEYSEIGLTLRDGYPSYEWRPIKNNKKFSDRKDEILGNAWARYKNHPNDENMRLLVKHANSTTGRLKQIRDLHFVWQCSQVGQSIPFSGGDKYPDIPKGMSFEEWYYFGELDIYRGVRGPLKPIQDDKSQSWSFSLPVAKSFADFDKTMPSRMWGPADKYGGEKHVLKGKVHPYQVIAYEDDNEAEVIVRTGDVRVG